ncbi:hypothetical protein SI859A1_01496 [Aurantimonas manganoxydans SI85-9A1]|uniref:Uncharacterized protein n=1 Tax=Aurantimonas manganoxydans (strain ATCC BAA-1229 / DSM 21871 / SI85-9A1) TaxID=287752 RepID=Q1YII1_AURMS|nr:hypothetical protein SI859A1_01496 [Aurantimonas manganoxydans SI85-9A1]
MRVTAPSTCSWLDHSVSGLIRRTERPVQTRFRYASTYRLKLARQTKSLTHYTKGTMSPRTNLELHLFVGIRFQVLFHSPCRGAFHLSLTVLVRYRSCTST